MIVNYRRIFGESKSMFIDAANLVRKQCAVKPFAICSMNRKVLDHSISLHHQTFFFKNKQTNKQDIVVATEPGTIFIYDPVSLSSVFSFDSGQPSIICMSAEKKYQQKIIFYCFHLFFF